MSKSTIIYSRVYDIKDAFLYNPDDTISQDLEEICSRISPSDSYLENDKRKNYAKFQIYDQGLFTITLGKEAMENRKYKRIVLVESMPASASFPIELAELLIRKGFEKRN
jgi:hypothetical protein